MILTRTSFRFTSSFFLLQELSSSLCFFMVFNTINGPGFCNFARQRNPKGAAEFDWNIWKFQKDQDLRLRVGYEMFEKVLKSMNYVHF